jgi:hypothetical protein
MLAPSRSASGGARGERRTEMAGLVDRMVRAAKLEPALYEEVEADTGATSQAMIVVVLSSLAAGVGSWPEEGVGGAISSILLALGGWVAWAFMTYVLGTKLLAEPQTRADIGQLLRAIGFATAPGIVRVFGFIPILGSVLGFAASVWMLVAFVIAVRQALDYTSTGRAVVVCFVGWLVYVGITLGLVAALIAATGVVAS